MAERGLDRVVQYLLHAARGRAGGTLSDAQLLGCFLSGRSEAAFDALVHRHGPMVLGVCRRMLGQDSDAQDAFQAAFLLLLRKGRSIRPRAKVGNWLYGVAYRVSLKARAVRRKRWDKERPLHEADEPQAPLEASAEWLALLDRELCSLPAKYRMPILLCDLEGKTQSDAARQLGWKEGTLSGRLSRARVLLCRRLTRRGFTLSVPAMASALSVPGLAQAVPLELAAATIKAVSFTGIKQAVAAGAVSAQAALLTEGVLQAMLWTKFKTGVVGVLAVAVVVSGLGQTLYTASGQGTAPGAAAPQNAAKEVFPQAARAQNPARTKDLEAKLQSTGNFSYKKMALGEVLDDLRRTHKINIFLDENAIIRDEPEGAAVADREVSVKLDDVPLETALRYLLKSSKLSFVNQDGILVVTSKDKTMVRKVYPVGELVGKDEDKNAAALIQVIVNIIEPESWSLLAFGGVQPQMQHPGFNQNIFNPFVGFMGMGGGAPAVGAQMGIGGGMFGAGPPPAPRLPAVDGGPVGGLGAAIAYFPGTKTLIIRQSYEGHREIEELLKSLEAK